jgi:hypothetical protein
LSNQYLRILDFRLSESVATRDEEITGILILDNTGPSQIQQSVNINAPSSFTVSPSQLQVTIDSGERLRYEFTVKPNKRGEYLMSIGGATRPLSVRSKSNATVGASIQSRFEKERIQKPPSFFRDGDGVSSEFRESDDIPPVETGDNERLVSAASGNLYGFNNIGKSDGQFVTIQPDSSKSPEDSLNIGFSTSFVPDNDVYTLFVEYSYQGNGQGVVIQPVGPGSDDLDTKTTYALPNTGGTTTRAFQLSPEEAQTVRQSNELYFTVKSTQRTTTRPTLEIDRLWLVSTTNPIDRSGPTLQYTQSPQISSTSEPRGAERTITTTVENTGNSYGTQDVVLQLKHLDSSPTTTQKRIKRVTVNPNSAKQVEFVVYRYQLGTHSYRIVDSGYGAKQFSVTQR